MLMVLEQKQLREQRAVDYFPTLLEMVLSYLDGRMMKKALDELDPFVRMVPIWQWKDNLLD